MLTRCCSLSLIATALTLPSGSAHAFCGFYVGKADSSLFNDASQVVLVRDGDRTVVTMSNDYKGELTDFALVVPLPSVITKDQIHIGDRKYIERLDAYSAPRLVEYHDPDPCAIPEKPMARLSIAAGVAEGVLDGMVGQRAHALGVTVEASYAIGEYDILILSAKESAGLETWLRESGYRIPAKASAALAPYIRQGMKFFVAKVNLKNQKAGGFNYLRPIQIAYESPKFMLPIRLGMANARGLHLPVPQARGWNRNAATRPSCRAAILLGTGTPGPDPERSGPATAIAIEDRAYLVDFGPGIVRRASAAAAKGVQAVRPTNLKTAFVTHLHSDHTDLIHLLLLKKRTAPSLCNLCFYTLLHTTCPLYDDTGMPNGSAMAKDFYRVRSLDGE